MNSYTYGSLSENFDSDRATQFFSGKARGALVYGVMSISSADNLENYRLMKFLWNAFLTKYQDYPGANVDAMKAGMRELNLQLNRIVANAENTIRVDLVVSTFIEAGVYFGMIGDIGLYMIRDGEVNNVGDILRSNKVITGSAQAHSEDILVLTCDEKLSEFLEGSDHVDTKPLVNFLRNTDPSPGRGTLLVSNDLDLYQFEDGRSEEGELDAGRSASLATLELQELDSSPDAEHEFVDVGVDSEDERSEIMETVLDVEENEVVEDELPRQSSPILRSDRMVAPPKLVPAEEYEEDLDEAEGGSFLESVKTLPAKIKHRVQNIDYSELKERGAKFQEDLKPRMSHFNRAMRSRAEQLKDMVINSNERKAAFKKLSAALSRFRQDASEKGIKLGDYKVRDMRNKRLLQAGMVLIILTVIFVGYRSAQNYRLEKEANAAFQKELDEVVTLRDDARSSAKTNPDESIRKIGSLRDRLEMMDAKNSMLEAGLVKSYNEISESISPIEDDIYKRTALSEESGNIELYLDGKVHFGGTSAPTDIGIIKYDDGGEGLLITDEGLRSTYSVNLSDKSIAKLSDSNNVVKSPVAVDYGTRGAYIYDSEAGIVNYPYGENDFEYGDARQMSGVSAETLGGDDVVELTILTSGDWVYVLNVEKQAVLKSDFTGSGYRIPFEYYSDPKLAEGTDLFSDLGIYLLSKSSDPISRYNGTGSALVQNPWTITGLREDAEAISAGYAGGDLNYNFYAFDDMLKSLLVFEKPIEANEGARHPGELLFMKQYVYRGDKENVFTDIKDIVVDSSQRFAYILDGSRVWKVTL